MASAAICIHSLDGKPEPLDVIGPFGSMDSALMWATNNIADGYYNWTAHELKPHTTEEWAARCARCGEAMTDGEPRAEIYSTAANPDFDPPPNNMHAIVHAEPC